VGERAALTDWPLIHLAIAVIVAAVAALGTDEWAVLVASVGVAGVLIGLRPGIVCRLPPALGSPEHSRLVHVTSRQQTDDHEARTQRDRACRCPLRSRFLHLARD